LDFDKKSSNIRNKARRKFWSDKRCCEGLIKKFKLMKSLEAIKHGLWGLEGNLEPKNNACDTYRKFKL
jgi:hypothetical protein